MNATTENSTEKSLEKVRVKKPLSVYSLNFSEALNNFAEKRHIVKRGARAGEVSARGALSKKIFNRRNAALLAAILTIGVLHFALQMSFIRKEVSKTRPAIEVPQIRIEPVSAPPVNIEPDTFDVKKAPVRQSQKIVLPVKPRLPQSEAAPSKPQPKKTGESRAERLRRVERLLTGI